MNEPTQEQLDAMQEHLQKSINSAAKERPDLERLYDQVWNTDELQAEFHVHTFAAPFVMVTRKSDNEKGYLVFQHAPRYYWGFTPEKELGL